jgi:hypothetical protein
MAHKLMHVSFSFPGVPKILDLEPVFNSLGDEWIRYSPFCWFVWTEKSSQQIFLRLRPHIDTHDGILVFKVTITEGQITGSLDAWVWDWLNKRNLHILTGTAAAQSIYSRPALPPPKSDT